MGQAISEPAKEIGFEHRFRWHDCTWEEIETFAERDTVIVIPTGSVEQHGLHLPLFTDTYIVLVKLPSALFSGPKRKFQFCLLLP